MMERCTLQLSAEDRFDRLRRIDWWEQDRLQSAKILVLGAGALGNEILKNLALLAIVNIFVPDLARIEESNLPRSVLFREPDVVHSNDHVAAEADQVIPPDRIVP